MKKNLLLLFVCLFGALGGVKAYNFATPTVGGTYYLVNREYGQFWYASSSTIGETNRYYGVTGDLSKATPVTVESGFKLAFNVGGTTYRMYEDKKGNTSLNEGGMDLGLNGSPSDGYNIDHHWQTTVLWVTTDHHRYLRAEGSESTCDWPGNTDDNKTNWYFVPKDDIANYLAEVVDWTGDTGIYDGVAPERYNGNNKDFTAGDILYQTINNLPNGNYEVTLWAWENFAPWERDSNLHPTGDNIAQVFANDATYGINVIENTGGRGWNNENKYTLNCHVTNGTLTYGVKNIATGGNWAVCRPISLTYTGPYSEVVTVGETKSYLGVFTADVTLEPTAEYPIVDISGAEFTGTLTADFDSDANGFIIATAEQKAALGDVNNVVVGNNCDNLVLTDGVKAVIPDALTHADNATYSRTIASTSNFGTICVPFALASNDDIQYYTVTRIIDDVLKLETVDNVDPGTPAIFKKKGASAESIIAAASNVDVVNGADEQSATGVKLVGTFEPITVGGSVGSGDAHGKYYIKNNQFCEGVDYFNVKAFRAYLETVVSGARLALQVEDEATAINELKTLDEKQGLKDGKYLIGGKIVVVKDGRQFYVNGVLK